MPPITFCLITTYTYGLNILLRDNKKQKVGEIWITCLETLNICLCLQVTKMGMLDIEMEVDLQKTPVKDFVIKGKL